MYDKILEHIILPEVIAKRVLINFSDQIILINPMHRSPTNIPGYSLIRFNLNKQHENISRVTANPNC